MFSLIITIISIALVAALAIATIYYGGSAFTQGSAKAAASTIINGAQQINGAKTIAKSQGKADSVINSLSNLVAEDSGAFLQGTPAAPANVTFGNDITSLVTAAGSGITADVCSKVNESAGLGSTIPGTHPATGVYSCAGTTGAYTFQFANK